MSLLSLLYRTAGAWGAGKGSNLTAAEVDDNFFDIESAVNELVNNPVLPAEIESASMGGTFGDQLTFTLSDATVLPPVTIPLGKPKWRGEWTAETDYAAGDLFRATDETGLYGLQFTNRNFTSGLAFNSTEGAGIGGVLPFASFVFAIPNKYRVAWFWPTQPGVGLPVLESSGDFAPLFSFLVTDQFFLPPLATGSLGNLRTAPVADLAFYIRRNGEQVGNVVFAAGSHTPLFAAPDGIQFEVGDVVTLDLVGAPDALAECLSITLVGTLGTLDNDSSSS